MGMQPGMMAQPGRAMAAPMGGGGMAMQPGMMVQPGMAMGGMGGVEKRCARCKGNGFVHDSNMTHDKPKRQRCFFCKARKQNRYRSMHLDTWGLILIGVSRDMLDFFVFVTRTGLPDVPRGRRRAHGRAAVPRVPGQRVRAQQQHDARQAARPEVLLLQGVLELPRQGRLRRVKKPRRRFQEKKEAREGEEEQLLPLQRVLNYQGICRSPACRTSSTAC